MDMSHGDSMSSGPACKISMLWNWNTVDACFISESWHVRSKGAFAGSVIGVFLLVIAIEAVRRAGREYDRYITRLAMAEHGIGTTAVRVDSANKATGSDEEAVVPAVGGPGGVVQHLPSWPRQIFRGFIYGSQFTASFLVMLLGMYYNGYMLFAIFLGHTVGYTIFARDTLASVELGSGHCC